MSRLLELVLVALLLPAVANTAETYVPEDLQEWQEWVLKDREYLQCPFFFDHAAADRADFVCAWPGLLELAVRADGATFTQQWTVYGSEQWIALPGETQYWPHAVTANGRGVEVVLHDDNASVRLGPGSYRLAGGFEWDERPGVLRIPDSSGLVSLSVDGRRVERPERNNGGLFLGEIQVQAQARNAVSTNVYRLVADDVPTRMTTTLRIDISGGVREELFGPLLPSGFVPLAINSQLPARLEPDGNLRVQVRPGRWVITLTARGAGVLDRITLPGPELNLPSDEIWSYRSNGRLRVTAAEGLPPVDPSQVDVPRNWQQLPAFRILPGESLILTERSRGIVSADNELQLSRQMWLDFDAAGFMVSDDVSGTMRSDWRMDMATPFALLSAEEAGQNLLVTGGQQEGQTGVELRRKDVDFSALGRTATRSAMPVSGWDERFANVSTTLHLPPGNKLLAAPGADQAPGSWVSQWRLLDFFLVLIITIAAWRMFGVPAGIIALLALVLSFHELNAPTWVWLNLLIAIALLRVAPAGKLRLSVQTYQAISAVLLVFVLVPFLASQLRIAIYPQLEPQAPSRLLTYGFTGPASVAEPARALARSAGPMEEQAMQKLAQADRMVEVAPAAQKAPISYARYAPNAMVQAGRGIPSWAWNSYKLDWNGPVDANQTMRLVILPRWVVTLLRLVEVVALLLFAAVFAAEIFRRRISLPGGLGFGTARASGIVAAGLLALFISASPHAEAQMPYPELLQELENRLLEPPECAPRCAEVVAANVDINASNVSMRLTVHALADVAVPLPGSDRGWRPAAVLLDGSAAGRVLRGRNQALWLQLSAGRHLITLSGALPAVDSLEIPFPAPPRVIEADSTGWFVAGIKDRRLLSGSLQLTRLQAEASEDATLRWESSRFPAFVRIERSIDLDLDWHATTTVFRVAPTQGALTLDIPLIEGESVLTDGIPVTDGRVLVSMNPSQQSVSWRSSLPRVSPLVLSAEAGEPWKEVWWVGVGSIWHAEFSGVPESESPGAPAIMRTAEFYPRGGETLTIDATRPEASQGSTLAFDSVDVRVEHGERSSTATLGLKYRSTRGAQHVVRLPDGAEVTEVSIDGRLEPLRADAGTLTLPILPGEHEVSIRWRSNGDIGARVSTPVVDIGAPASNIALHSELPRNRWLLATSGPKLGPAVLYWSELAVLLLFAVILGRVELAPLGTRHWLLLGLGFSTFSWPVLGVVVAWLLICGARQKWDGETNWWQFDLVQILIGGASIVALIAIVTSLPGGLLGTPDMHVAGQNSFGNTLNWFADSSDSVLPTATAWSLPMWIYKTLILAWALWLSFALLRWLPWVWQCFSSKGYWRPRGSTAGAAGNLDRT